MILPAIQDVFHINSIVRYQINNQIPIGDHHFAVAASSVILIQYRENVPAFLQGRESRP